MSSKFTSRETRPVRSRRGHFLALERRHEGLIPWDRFVRRVGLSLLLAGGIVAIALLIGVTGYHGIVGLSWADAILNASMILTGMGPVAPMPSTAAKLFASAYALFSGVVFLSATSIILAPVFHRFLHKFHLADEDENTP